MKDREIKSTIITLFLVSIFLFALIYFIHTKNIENRFDKALENYTTHLQSITTNNTVINLDTKILESSMTEIMKNSNDLLNFWFAFLSVIMIVFTFASIFINNNILSESKENLKYINDLKKDIENYKEKIHNYELSIKNLQLKIDTETQRKISELEKNSNQFLREINEKNSDALNSIDKLKIEFNNSINLIQEKSNQMILDIKEQAQTESKQLIESIKDKAEEETKKLIEKNNINIQISNLLNSAYQASNNKDYNSCIDYYNQIIEMTDELLKEYDENSEEYYQYKNNYLIAYNNRGNAKKNLKQYKEAIKDYNKAIELNPNISEAYFNMVLPKQLLANNTENKKERNKLIEEAYNDFIEGYKLADDKLKDEYKQKAIIFAKQGYKAIIKICNKMGWKY